MEVWVVWSGRAPVAAFSSRQRAEAFIAKRRSEVLTCSALQLNADLSLALG